MSLTLDEYRCKLVNKLLFAATQTEVQRFIDAGLKGLEAHAVNGHIIVRFLDKIVEDLNEFNPVNYDAQQWSNIKVARILFNKAKRSLQSEQT